MILGDFASGFVSSVLQDNSILKDIKRRKESKLVIVLFFFKIEIIENQIEI